MNMAVKYLKEITKLILAAVYAVFLCLSDTKLRRVVIYYHGIGQSNAEKFEKQMAYLAKKCLVVKPSKIRTAKGDGTQVMVAITFDDAFVSIIENAIPILRKYELPAGIFVPVNNLARKPCWKMPENYPDKKEIVMSKEQVEQLDKEGFEMFSHTLSHPELAEISFEQLKCEIVESKQKLEEMLAHEVMSISYPYGSYNNEVLEVAINAGYRYGFTIEPRCVSGSENCLALPRFTVSPEDNMLKFKLTICGAYNIIGILRKKFGKCL